VLILLEQKISIPTCFHLKIIGKQIIAEEISNVLL
jgi:hypothetical protein